MRTMAGSVRGASSFGPWIVAVAALMAVLLPGQVGAKTAAAAAAAPAAAGARRIGFISHNLPRSSSSSSSSPRSSSSRRTGAGASKMEVFEGNAAGKAIWDFVWKLPIMRKGEQGAPIEFGDVANVLRKNIEQIYGNEPSVDGAPLAEGEVSTMTDGTAFLGLFQYFQKYGPVYKLCFGPKSFIVLSDPTIIKHVLKTNNAAYDKGLLAEILEPIMGKGLIPADNETWKVRRRAIVPAFHQQWLEHMVGLFGGCSEVLMNKLADTAEAKEAVDMETLFCSVSLDIIGKAVFNYPFDSVTKESPIIKSVYNVLQEAEHRSVTPLPYWNLPFANFLVPRLRKFKADLKVINDILDELIEKARNTREESDLQDLEKRNYDKVGDASLLRFLVDLRGEDTSNKQLRDDLMTMLIAGHETTAAVLTWALFEIAQDKEIRTKLQAEVDRVCGDRMPTLADIKEMQLVRFAVAECLRMYPEPPLLIRRALEDHVLPKGTAAFETKIIRGCDIFISVYNLHRDPDLWPNPNKFDPERFLRPYSNKAKYPDWDGFDPSAVTGLYPNEVAADFALLPFGGGARKCVGDQFATLEATVTLAMLLRRFDFDFVGSPADVGMKTGATIHTRNGLMMTPRKRVVPASPAVAAVEAPVAARELTGQGA